MDHNNNDKPKASSYGGGESRLKYEGKNKSLNEKMVLTILIFIIAIISVFAIIGIISLAGGNIFSSSDNNSGALSDNSIKVPTNSEISGQNNIESILEKAKKSVVLIKADYNDGSSLYRSGFFISHDGYIATQIIDDPQNMLSSISVYLNENDNYSADIVGNISVLGISFLHLPALDKANSDSIIPDFTLGNSSFIKQGTSIWAISAESSEFPSFSMHGMVSGINKASIQDGGEKKNFTMIYSDFKINPSIAGAPIINSSGEIIGMCSDKIPAPYEDISAIIPINTVILLGNDIINSNR